MMKCSVLAIAVLASAAATAQPATATGALERVVTGVPFSAESVTEYVQTISDGSHVKKETTALVARDSNGRTRYSQAGLRLLPGAPKIFSTIRDPVAGVRYWIDPDEKLARRELIRRPEAQAANSIGTATGANSGATADGHDGGDAQEAAIKIARQSIANVLSAHGKDLAGAIRSEVTPLGNRVIENVHAAGARAKVLVPAGQIGNDSPLVFRSETWYSPELSIVVLSRVIDPIMGETIFQLTHLRRGEPDSSVFQVPSGYRITGVPTEPRVKD
jgi:hypothetical protein